MNKSYILYDARALTQDTFDCSVAICAESKRAAKVDSLDYPDDYVWYEYDEKIVPEGKNQLINEKLWKTNGEVKKGGS